MLLCFRIDTNGKIIDVVQSLVEYQSHNQLFNNLVELHDAFTNVSFAVVTPIQAKNETLTKQRRRICIKPIGYSQRRTRSDIFDSVGYTISFFIVGDGYFWIVVMIELCDE